MSDDGVSDLTMIGRSVVPQWPAPDLTAEQRAAWAEIFASLDRNVPGTWDTQAVRLRLVNAALDYHSCEIDGYVMQFDRTREDVRLEFSAAVEAYRLATGLNA